MPSSGSVQWMTSMNCFFRKSRMLILEEGSSESITLRRSDLFRRGARPPFTEARAACHTRANVSLCPGTESAHSRGGFADSEEVRLSLPYAPVPVGRPGRPALGRVGRVVPQPDGLPGATARPFRPTFGP